MSGYAHVRNGSWLCKNAKTLNRDRRSYSSKTVLVAQRASGFNLEIELKNIILRRVSIFEFLHSQGHTRTWGQCLQRSASGQQPTSLAHWTRSIHFTKNHSFHVGKDAVALRQLQQVLPLRSVRQAGSIFTQCFR